MRARCSGKSHNPNDRQYATIRIHTDWIKDFRIFMLDVGPRPSKEHTLDRHPNKTGDYVPGNVRWATKEEQAINRRSTRFLTLDNKTKPLSHWSKIFGVSTSTISRRLRNGWSVRRAVTEAADLTTSSFANGLNKGKKLTVAQALSIVEKAKSGEANLSELAREFGVAPTSILNIVRKFGVVAKKRHSKLRSD